ncbi:hypothetical protein [Halocatena pleomorpha]|uniref:hypothetical protein n=1 Tax=Halocatena pleomorpha TaxID=1785090 RepID=UPI000F610733|nr:hypothetical protein [Halocatena pleomorpha]
MSVAISAEVFEGVGLANAMIEYRFSGRIDHDTGTTAAVRQPLTIGPTVNHSSPYPPGSIHAGRIDTAISPRVISDGRYGKSGARRAIRMNSATPALIPELKASLIPNFSEYAVVMVMKMVA